MTDKDPCFSMAPKSLNTSDIGFTNFQKDSADELLLCD